MSAFNFQDPDFDSATSNTSPIMTASPASSFLGGINAKIAFLLGMGAALAASAMIGFFTLLYFFLTK